MKKQAAKYTLNQLTPRREPRQLRSRILFDKIIATAKMLFERDGYAFVTTNKIAEQANISIGSLYQYFKNCESIALVVYENACAKAALEIKRKTLQSLGRPLETSIPRHIEHLFNIFEADRYALLQLVNEVPELRRISQPVALDSLCYHTAQMFLEQYFTEVDPAVIARKAYFINKCVLGMISWYLDERPALIGKDEVIAEMTELIYRYVTSLPHHRIAASRARRH
jgi:AcrR family transcriptional regulator